nr:MAG TPA: hypothetical protein [Caudoviricetes sp.]
MISSNLFHITFFLLLSFLYPPVICYLVAMVIIYH